MQKTLQEKERDKAWDRGSESKETNEDKDSERNG